MSSSQLPTRMQAWRKHKGKTEPVFEEVDVPTTPPKGYLVRVLAAGVCHTDHVIVNSTMHPPYFNDQFTLGHEGCGVIVGIGSEVSDHSYKLGDKVAVFAIPGCGNKDCPECSRGLPQLCATGEHYGLGQDGSFTEYIAVQERAVVPLPEGVSPMAGAVATDAVVTGFHAVFRRGEIKSGDTVLLIGLGGLGFNALQMLCSRDIRVIASDVKEELVEAAIAQGVPKDDVVPIGTSLRDFAKERGLEGKFDVVLEFVGLTQTFKDAQLLVRRGGKIVVIGGMSNETQINMQLCLTKRLSVLFTYGGDREDLVEVLSMISKGHIKPQVQVDKLENFAQVLKDLHAGKITGRVALAPKGIEFETMKEASIAGKL